MEDYNEVTQDTENAEATGKDETNDKNVPQKFNTYLLYLLIGLMILTGSSNTIFNKILQKMSSLAIPFEQHHWIITFGMFIGEFVSLIVYYINKAKAKYDPRDGDTLIQKNNCNAEEEEGKTKENNEEKEKEGEENVKKPPVPTNLIFALSASCDLCASTINTFGLTYLTTSIYQMMRGMELFFVCLWSRVFLKNDVYRHHILGIGTLIFGLFLVGLNSVLNAGNDKEVARNPLVGLILMCISQIFSSTCYTIQESFIKRYDINSFQLVGYEGLWGSCLYTIILIICQNISCKGWSLADEICFDDENGNVLVENTLFAFKQLGNNAGLLILFISYIVSIALYNIVGINLTKLVSSTARAVVDTVRTVFIWAFFLFFEPVKGTKEHFYPLQFVGFCLLVLGTIIYNEIIEIKLCNLDYYTRENIRKRKIEEQKLIKDANGDNNSKDQLYKSINRDSDLSGITDK